MTPIDFPESTTVLAKDQPQYRPLPVHSDGNVVTSCWKLSWWERARVFLTGRMWFQQMTFGGLLQPQLPQVTNPLAAKSD